VQAFCTLLKEVAIQTAGLFVNTVTNRNNKELTSYCSAIKLLIAKIMKLLPEIIK